MLKKQTEKDIEKAILEWLSWHGYLAEKMHLGGVMGTAKDGRQFRRPNPMTGFPDIWGVLKSERGRMFVLEVKTKTGRMSPYQTEWERRCEAHGIRHAVVTSLEEAIRKITEWGT